MKEEADAVKAPMEIMLISNSGHNCRRVNADIESSRDAVIDRTVSFFDDHL